MVEKLVKDRFLKNQNQTYLRINSLNLYGLFFILCLRRALPKYIETKVKHVTLTILTFFFFFAGESISEIYVKTRRKSGRGRGRVDGEWDRRVIGLGKREEFILHKLLSWQL